MKLSELTHPIVDVNLYGVIYDSTFPNAEEGLNSINLICAIKLIDQDINCLSYPQNINDEAIYIIIKSNDKRHLPFIGQIGQIMRIHRGVFKPKKRKNVYLNFSSNSKVNSSWCIYESELYNI